MHNSISRISQPLLHHLTTKTHNRTFFIMDALSDPLSSSSYIPGLQLDQIGYALNQCMFVGQQLDANLDKLPVFY